MASSARIDELRKKFDENPRRYFAPLANEYRKAGDLEQAIFICQEYLPQQPGHMSGHIVYGQALFELGRTDEARAVFETALTLDPENLIALRHLGDIARQGGDLKGARSWYQRVLEADPRNEEIAEIMLTVLTTPHGAQTAVTSPDTAAPGTDGPGADATSSQGAAQSLSVGPELSALPERQTPAEPQADLSTPAVEPQPSVSPAPVSSFPMPGAPPFMAPAAPEPSPEAIPEEELLDLNDFSIGDVPMASFSPPAAEEPAPTAPQDTPPIPPVFDGGFEGALGEGLFVPGLPDASLPVPPAPEPAEPLPPEELSVGFGEGAFEVDPFAIASSPTVEEAAAEPGEAAAAGPQDDLAGAGSGGVDTTGTPALDGLESFSDPSFEISQGLTPAFEVGSFYDSPPAPALPDAASPASLSGEEPASAIESVAASLPAPAPEALPVERIEPDSFEVDLAGDFGMPEPSSNMAGSASMPADAQSSAGLEPFAADEPAPMSGFTDAAGAREDTPPADRIDEGHEIHHQDSHGPDPDAPDAGVPITGAQVGAPEDRAWTATESHVSGGDRGETPASPSVDSGQGDDEQAEAPEFVTETMAELYLQQGHLDAALDIYRRLSDQRPDDAYLRDRVRVVADSILTATTVSSTEGEHSAPSAMASDGPTIRAFLSALLRGGARTQESGTVQVEQWVESSAEPSVQPVDEGVNSPAETPVESFGFAEAFGFAAADETPDPSGMPHTPDVAAAFGAVDAPAEPVAPWGDSAFADYGAEGAAGVGQTTAVDAEAHAPTWPPAAEPEASSPPAAGDPAQEGPAVLDPSPEESAPAPAPTPREPDPAVPAGPEMETITGSIDLLFAGAEAAESDTAAASTLAQAFASDESDDVPLEGMPAHRAADELSLDRVFKANTAPRPETVSDGFSFDQFFSAEISEPAPGVGAEPSAASTTPADDIAQFTTWLNGLKKT